MKTNKNRNSIMAKAGRFLLVGTVCASTVSCDSFLLREPPKPSVEQYLTTTESLAAYVDENYVGWLPNHGYSNATGYNYGLFKNDGGTDNQAGRSADNRYLGLSEVSEGTGDWNFESIYQCNWFFEQVEGKLNRGEIIGDQALARHYLGEMYFFRAYLYFGKLQVLGDLPIIDKVLPDDKVVLIENSKRRPRNEVARFIINDLQKAADLMSEVTVATTRVSEKVAYLMMSRVALYEGTWLKYFKSTPFVPLGEGWPGFGKEYSSSYQYPSGNIDDEIKFFLNKAMLAAKIVADGAVLTENSGIVPQVVGEKNPYLEMFGDDDLSVYPEVLLWMDYAKTLVTHGAVIFAQEGNNGVGLTRGYVDNFLMQNGLPVYAAGSGYAGDATFSAVRTGRDLRLFTFLQEPGQKNWLNPESTEGGAGNETVVVPRIDLITGKTAYSTGYAMRKGNSLDRAQSVSNGSWTGCVVFRSVEVLLNYIEASIELNNGQLTDLVARTYWEKLRNRSGITASIETTVGATVMVEEAKNDWGAYSAGVLIEPMLYNIRRERRSEFIGDGFRMMDLKRWRAMDQLINEPYHIEGIHIYDPVMEAYLKAGGVSFQDRKGEMSVSPKENSEYFRIYQINGNTNLAGYNGLSWRMGHYLNPIGSQEFLLTSSDGATKDTSPIYQNPYWTMEANSLATK